MFDGRNLSVVLPAILLIGHTMTFPMGTLDVPDRCRAPATIGMNMLDGFIGSIECPTDKLNILVYGDVYMGDVCKAPPQGTKGTQGAPTRMSLTVGGSLAVCVKKRRGGGPGEAIEETFVDLRGGYLSAEIRSPQQLALLKEIARSFRTGQQ